MKMREAEQEVLRLFPEGTVFLAYERRHYTYSFPTSGKGFGIECSIWIDDLKEHFRGENWASAVNALREYTQDRRQEACPDEEEDEEGVEVAA